MNYLLKEVSSRGVEKVKEYNDYETLNAVFNSFLDKDLADVRSIYVIDAKTNTILSLMTLVHGTNCVFSVGDTVKVKTNNNNLYTIKRFDFEVGEDCAHIEILDENGVGTGRTKCFGLEGLSIEKKAKRGVR